MFINLLMASLYIVLLLTNSKEPQATPSVSIIPGIVLVWLKSAIAWNLYLRIKTFSTTCRPESVIMFVGFSGLNPKVACYKAVNGSWRQIWLHFQLQCGLWTLRKSLSMFYVGITLGKRLSLFKQMYRWSFTQ